MRGLHILTQGPSWLAVSHLPFLCTQPTVIAVAMGELDATYGAALIGAFMCAVLFGMTNLQMFIYFQGYSSDGVWSKLTVCWLWLVDAIHLAFVVHMVYWYLVINHSIPSALAVIVWTFKAQAMLNVSSSANIFCGCDSDFAQAIVVISVQSLYAVRVWKRHLHDLSIFTLDVQHRVVSMAFSMVDNRALAFLKFLLITVAVIVILAYGVLIALCYEISRFREYTDFLVARYVTYLPLGVATCVDAIIASALCYLLRRCRTGYSKMDSTISVLMLFTVNTGILTTLCSLTAMTMLATLPDTFAAISVNLTVTHLYVNSFMAMYVPAGYC
ncbi:uncharacterized protein LAESUDRAFT_814857 [Laetiporus sulphureus 93-53]|uniref:DUF6534 domain-containing protein n=1 Tax=Laetiporus sulphureus 93-53 TaxID=1314785 RepID=A0A165CQ81_9APHY|nr:uncharacterized protein LAESUDRAFT_814857 [Laetiporus sulphureus 93-53]KZT03223.1 hypothetical protein LAESUDRAFT_814857 [Laetiporus sulphureus 93-53]